MKISFNQITPEGIQIQLPGSKSIANRYLILNHLTDQHASFTNFPDSRDCVLLLHALQNPETTAWFQDGATPYRFFLSWACAKGISTTLSGDEGLQKRSLLPLTEALEKMGAKIEYLGKKGFPPCRIVEPRLIASQVSIERSMSSQYVSSIMLVAPIISKHFTLKLFGTANSDSYIKLTADCMQEFGIAVNFKDSIITIDSAAFMVPESLKIESDWTSAGWFYSLCAAIPGSSFLLKDLSAQSKQADADMVGIFSALGVKSVSLPDGIFIFNSGEIAKHFQCNFSQYIDLAPAIICTCAYLRIQATFYGMENLAFKESNRILALSHNLRKFGVGLQQNESAWNLQYTNGSATESIEIETFHDHRMAMAFSIFALKTKLHFDDEKCVEKSFPHYWKQLEKCNFVIEHGT